MKNDRYNSSCTRKLNDVFRSNICRVVSQIEGGGMRDSYTSMGFGLRDIGGIHHASGNMDPPLHNCDISFNVFQNASTEAGVTQKTTSSGTARCGAVPSWSVGRGAGTADPSDGLPPGTRRLHAPICRHQLLSRQVHLSVLHVRPARQLHQDGRRCGHA